MPGFCLNHVFMPAFGSRLELHRAGFQYWKLTPVRKYLSMCSSKTSGPGDAKQMHNKCKYRSDQKGSCDSLVLGREAQLPR